MATAADVPNRFDCVIDSNGFMFADTQEIKAEFGFSPTFLARTNITGNYGDNQQDFWMTSKQNDWSLGEQQQYLRVNDDVSVRRFWQGTNIDVRKPGQVTLRQDKRTATFAAATACACSHTDRLAVATATTLYTITADGTIASIGAHGCGATPTGIVSDSVNIFFAASGSSSIRKYNGSVFSNYATGINVRAIEYLNNGIYGLEENTAAMALYRFDSAGAWTGIHEWKTGLGGNRLGVGSSKIRAFGGKLLILLTLYDSTELWIYDGQGVSMLAALPSNFIAGDVAVLHGIVFLSGLFVTKSTGSVDTCVPGIYFYANGQIGQLWKADASFAVTLPAQGISINMPVLATYDSGLVFNDDTRGTIMYYDIVNGGVHTLCSYTVSGTVQQIAATRRFFLHLRNLTTATQFPHETTVASSGTVISSLMDFDTSQNKLFRTVRVDATIPATASIDIERQLDAVDAPGQACKRVPHRALSTRSAYPGRRSRSDSRSTRAARASARP